MASSRIDLLNHNFPRSFRGYSTKDVDLFIQELADSLARLGEEKVTLASRVAALEAKITEHEQRENSLRQTLVATQRMMEDIKNSAQREAQLIIESARGKAENLSAQGSMRLARIMDEISDAHRIKAQFEFQLRSVIERHLKLLQMSREEEQQLLDQVASLGSKPVGAQGAQFSNAISSAVLHPIHSGNISAEENSPKEATIVTAAKTSAPVQNATLAQNHSAQQQSSQSEQAVNPTQASKKSENSSEPPRQATVTAESPVGTPSPNFAHVEKSHPPKTPAPIPFDTIEMPARQKIK